MFEAHRLNLGNAGVDRHVSKYHNSQVPRLHAQRSGQHSCLVDSHAPLPFLDDGIHTIHRRSGRAGQDGAKDDCIGRHAKTAAAQEPHGLYSTGKEELLHFYSERHPGRSGSDRCPQEFAENPGTTTGDLYSMGTGQHSSGPHKAEPLHPNGPPCQWIDAGKPHQYRNCKFHDPDPGTRLLC